MTALPTPEQWCIVKMTEQEVAEEIERHIDYVDEDGNSVHLPMQFVRHMITRADHPFPRLVAIAALPIILADGGVLALDFDDIDVDRGIEFVIPPEVMAILPKRKNCTPGAVKKAMQFLTDEWLCDVSTDFAGKCMLIAAGLTVIERSLLPDRPVFFVTAGRRGSGKTTSLTMMIIGVTGIWPAAAAWSSNEEERRKALLSYFLYGMSQIVWDNIPRGTQISCPHLEKSCTAAYYSDRKLGVSEMVCTAASTIHFFTGNNIGPRGDLSSRSLQIRLEVDRADPENREFKHSDPIEWTKGMRAEILQALYTILLGNPTLDLPRDAPMNTRFKMWWRLVGSAVEHAAKLTGNNVDFQTLFLTQEDEDEDSTSLAEVLEAMAGTWPDWIKAATLTDATNSMSHLHRETLRGFFCPTLREEEKVSVKSVGRKLKQHVGEPVRSSNKTLILRSGKDAHTNSLLYKVEARPL